MKRAPSPASYLACWRIVRLPAVVLPAVLLLTGCPEQMQSDKVAPAAPCRELGQRCEFSPGKLGSCVVVDGCKSDNCFVCQSQH